MKRGLIVLLIGLIVYFLYRINQAPAFNGSFSKIAFTDISGQAQKLDAYHGKFVLLDLYASWCIDCIKAAPRLKSISDTLLAEGWMVVGITDDDMAHIERWQHKYKVNYPIWHLEQHYKTLGVTEIPSYFVLDKKGEVVRVLNAHEANMNLGFIDTLRKIKVEHE